MKFRTYVEPPEPMRGLEVPPVVVESLGQGKRPRVTITVNGRSWKSRVAIMRGRSRRPRPTRVKAPRVVAVVGVGAACHAGGRGFESLRPPPRRGRP
jgi:hypothetical protein